VEEERLDLDLPVQEYVRSFPYTSAILTARMLAAHLGGIRHYGRQDFSGRNIDRMHFDTVTAGLVLFKDDELVAEPGTKYSYSTFGFSLLSAVVEGAAETDFLTYLQATVLDPLAMQHTAADKRDVEMPDRTTFYEKGEDGVVGEAPYLDPSYKWAGGGLVGTAEDLVLFGTAHLAPGFLRSETLELAFERQHTKSGEEVRVGIGWFSGKDDADRRMIFHNGSQRGCRALLLAYRDEGLVIALLSNLSGTPGPIQDIGRELAEPFLAELAGAGEDR
jgi:CubicO group peptidase (beta-lactamase class C family)